MKFLVGVFGLLAVFGATDTDAALRPITVHVDCSVPPGGDGSRFAPFESITAALPLAEVYSVRNRVTIETASGVCANETFPIPLSFPVEIKGSRVPRLDGDGMPLPLQMLDTLVVRPAANPTPIALFEITGDGVRLSRLSIDGGIVLPGDIRVPPQENPFGVLARGNGLVIDRVRIVNVGFGIRSEGASGWITRNYIGSANVGIVLFGSDAVPTPNLVVTNNRVDYRVNGIACRGWDAAAREWLHQRADLEERRAHVVHRHGSDEPRGPADQSGRSERHLWRRRGLASHERDPRDPQIHTDDPWWTRPGSKPRAVQRDPKRRSLWDKSCRRGTAKRQGPDHIHECTRDGAASGAHHQMGVCRERGLRIEAGRRARWSID